MIKCLKIFFWILLIFFQTFLFLNPKMIYAAPCGNGQCQASENCLNCPADCGVCPTPTSPPPTPTDIVPTPTTIPEGPTPTSAPSGGGGASGGTTGGGNVYTPSVVLESLSSSFIKSSQLTIFGEAKIEQGTIERIEYRIDSGEWKNIKFGTNNKFSFEIFNISEGKHVVGVRATSLAKVGSGEATINFVVVLDPPKIILEKFPQNPTKNLNPTFNAVVTSKYGKISRVQISLDDGNNWFPMKLVKSKYQYISTKLDDGDYPIVVRAYDNAGNLSETKPEKLTIDTIPPIAGGVELSIGPQILFPNKYGTIRVSIKSKITLRISMRGGVNKAIVKIEEKSFPLVNITGSNQWIGTLEFSEPLEKNIEILASDGADNQIKKEIGEIVVEDYGQIIDNKNGLPIENANVQVHYFNDIINDWVLWDSESYGQLNPQKTDINGGYSFMLPKGKFHLEIKVPGYRSSQSEIFEVDDVTIVNTNTKINPLPSVNFKLPFFEKIKITLPNFLPPTSFKLDNLKTTNIVEVDKNKNFLLSEVRTNLIDWSLYKDNKLLITFFSPWSVLSQEQIKILSEVNKSLNAEQKILGVSLQETTDKTELFLKRGNYELQFVADQNGETANLFNISFLPQHFFVDSQGRISEIFNGIIDKKTILDKLNKLQ